MISSFTISTFSHDCTASHMTHEYDLTIVRVFAVKPARCLTGARTHACQHICNCTLNVRDRAFSFFESVCYIVLWYPRSVFLFFNHDCMASHMTHDYDLISVRVIAVRPARCEGLAVSAQSSHACTVVIKPTLGTWIRFNKWFKEKRVFNKINAFPEHLCKQTCRPTWRIRSHHFS